MLTKEMHKPDVEKELEGKGDFVKIDYLNRYLKLMPPMEMRKFAHLKLVEIYEKKKMFSELASAYRNAANNSTIFREKVEFYGEEAKAHVKKLDFIEADKAIKRAAAEGTKAQVMEMIEGVRNFYKEYAIELEKQLKRNQASKIYEKLLKMNIPLEEKEEIKAKLKNLYEKLGKTNEIKWLEGI
ncbi:MAG: hypothetical protein KC516_01240 [Nanoarchaeota archaeon]|nr:hypothetical protein [Nanoarchaeota archaeon]